MSKRALDKIKAGLDSARAYLDGTADKPDSIGSMCLRRLTCGKDPYSAWPFAGGLRCELWLCIIGGAGLGAGSPSPGTHAHVLLKIVEKEPEAVSRALAG